MLSAQDDVNVFQEPMSLGSPGSPPGSVSAPFLPSYLMGDVITGNLSPGPRFWSSGSQNVSKSSLNKSVSFQVPLNSPSFTSSPHPDSRTRGFATRTSKDKSGGPPVQGLLEQSSFSIPSLNTVSDRQQQLDFVSQSCKTPNSSFIDVLSTPNQSNMLLGPQSSTAFTPTQSFLNFKTSPSPSQIDPFYTQGDAITPNETLDETWVSVFGFPPAAASFIIQQFSQYGTILHHQMAANGNWMHIHYQSKLQAKKALSKNGKVFGNSIMIGVTPCIDKKVMNKVNQDMTASFTSSPQISDTTDFKGNMSFTNIRPLSVAYRTAISDHEVIPQGKTPQKSTNIIAKTMEYVFGW